TAPGQIVHVELWRVGHLDQEDAVLRNGAHRIEVGAAREHVEGVEHKPDGRMISAAHHLPAVAIVVDVSSPRERSERDATASPRRSLAELAEIRRCAVNAAEGIGGDIAADHQEIATELLHKIELALGAGECLDAQRFRHSLKVAKRLERYGRKAEILDPA